MDDLKRATFVGLMTVAVETAVEKGGICVF